MTAVHIVGASRVCRGRTHPASSPPIPTSRSRRSRAAVRAGQRVCDLFPSLPHRSADVRRRTGRARTAAARRLRLPAPATTSVAQGAAPALPRRRRAGDRPLRRLPARRDPAGRGLRASGTLSRRDRAGAGSSPIRGATRPLRSCAAAARAARPGASRTSSIDAKSGITGAGRNPALGSLFAEVDDDVHAYGLAGPPPPAGDRAGAARGRDRGAVRLLAARRPALARDARRRLRDRAQARRSRGAVAALYARAYADSPFVHVFDGGARTVSSAVAKTQPRADARRGCATASSHVLSAIDNLGKGAAGKPCRT